MEGMTDSERAQRDRDGGVAASVAAGAEQFAAEIRANTAFRFNRYSPQRFTYNAGSPEEVTEIAAALGVTAGWEDGYSFFRAIYHVNERVSYEAVSVTPPVLARTGAAVRRALAARTPEAVPA
jgi:hypothetical protein